jgi:2-keto-4-pentenoate hydratase
MTTIDNEPIQLAARALLDAHQRRARYEALPAAIRPRSLDQAYAVQAAFQGLLVPRCGAIAGYKIALTSRAMQDFVGIHHPLWGAIFADRIHASPAALSHAGFVHLGIECEIAVRLDRDLPAVGAPYGEAAVADAVAAAMPAFELVEDRNADYQALDAFGLVADNAWNAGIVLGPPIADWRARDLGSLQGSLLLNDAPAGAGHGRDALGHPLKALTWLANGLAARGLHLARGMVVMTGSIVTTKFLKSGDRARFVLDGLGEADLRVT